MNNLFKGFYSIGEGFASIGEGFASIFCFHPREYEDEDTGLTPNERDAKAIRGYWESVLGDWSKWYKPSEHDMKDIQKRFDDIWNKLY